MKKIFFVALSTVIIVASCKKDTTTTDTPSTDVNINYPAVYVVNGEDASVSVIKLSTQEVVATINLNAKVATRDSIMFPHHISYYGGRLSLGVPGMDFSLGHSGISTAGMMGRLLILDAVNGSTYKNMSLPLMNHNTIYSPDGKEVWVPQMDMPGNVLVYDATTFALKNTIPMGMMPAELTFSSNGAKAYVANGDDDNVIVIDVATKAVTATIAVGDNPVGAWTGSDGRMYVDNEDGQTISVINVAGDSVQQTIALGFMPGFAAHNSLKNELWVSDPMNGKVHYWTWDAAMNMWMHGGLFAVGAGAHAIAFTGDGNTAYVTNQTANTVSVVNVSTHAVSKTINVGKKPNGLVIKN